MRGGGISETSWSGGCSAGLRSVESFDNIKFTSAMVQLAMLSLHGAAFLSRYGGYQYSVDMSFETGCRKMAMIL